MCGRKAGVVYLSGTARTAVRPRFRRTSDASTKQGTTSDTPLHGAGVRCGGATESGERRLPRLRAEERRLWPQADALRRPVYDAAVPQLRPLDRRAASGRPAVETPDLRLRPVPPRPPRRHEQRRRRSTARRWCRDARTTSARRTRCTRRRDRVHLWFSGSSGSEPIDDFSALVLADGRLPRIQQSAMWKHGRAQPSRA
jgi:hypothetical protein